MTELVFQRLHPDARVPSRAYDGDAGLDLTSVEAAVIEPMQRRTSRPAWRWRSPQGTRGSSSRARGLHEARDLDRQHPGLDRLRYRGELKVVLLNTDREHAFAVAPGDRIAQLVVLALPRLEVVEADALPRLGAGRARIRVVGRGQRP